MKPPAPDQRLKRFLIKGRLRQIQMIVEVAEIGNVHEVARRLAVSQPAVTKAIQEAESLLGIKIFERHTKSPRNRQAVRVLFEWAQSRRA